MRDKYLKEYGDPDLHKPAGLITISKSDIVEKIPFKTVAQFKRGAKTRTPFGTEEQFPYELLFNFIQANAKSNLDDLSVSEICVTESVSIKLSEYSYNAIKRAEPYSGESRLETGLAMHNLMYSPVACDGAVDDNRAIYIRKKRR